jgi:hypothetical protein
MLFRAIIVTKNSIFWDITLCSPLKVNIYFGGTYRLHLQGRRISHARNHYASRWELKPLLVTSFRARILRGLFFGPEDGGDMPLWNIG